MLVKVELTAAWADELGWTDADIASVLDINLGSDVPDSPEPVCPRCRRQCVDFKIRFFKCDSAAATAQSGPGRAFVNCVCGSWYSYAVVDKMDSQTLVGQSHVPAALAAQAAASFLSDDMLPGQGLTGMEVARWRWKQNDDAQRMAAIRFHEMNGES